MIDSKQAVNVVLNGGNCGRIVYGEFAIDFDTIEKILGHETYVRAKAKTTIALWEGHRDEVCQSFKEDIVALYKALDGIDIINLAADFCGLLPPKDYDPKPPKKIGDGIWEDTEGRVYKYSDITKDITTIFLPDKHNDLKKENFKELPQHCYIDSSVFEAIDWVIQELGSEKFIISPAGREAGFILPGGMENGLMLYLDDPELVELIISYETKLGNLEDDFYVRKGADAVLWGQDFAYNSGLFLPPGIMKKIVFPSIKRRVKNIHNKFKLPVIKHACGNNQSIYDDFIDVGYNCYQSIQPIEGQDIEQLKELFGNSICLWGGIDISALLKNDKDSIKRDIKRIKKVYENSGGIIAGSSHSVAVGSSYDCFMLILDEINTLNN